MGFNNITESSPGKSKVQELQKLQHVLYDNKRYLLNFKFLKKCKRLESKNKILWF